MPIVKIELLINAPIEICFDLARSIDLHQISTSKTKERVIAGRMEGLIEKGETVTWRAKHFGVWQNLTAKITALESPNYFCDEMVKGAFKSFKHEHIFKKEGEQTLMIDIFDFESPFGWLGQLFNKIILTRYMRHFLEERNQIISVYAESDKWKSILK